MPGFPFLSRDISICPGERYLIRWPDGFRIENSGDSGIQSGIYSPDSVQSAEQDEREYPSHGDITVTIPSFPTVTVNCTGSPAGMRISVPVAGSWVISTGLKM